MNLKDSKLLRNRAYIDGRWVEADGGDRFPVTNPANGARLMEVPDMGAAETRRAIAAAWSGVLTPKPTQTGSGVAVFTCATIFATFSGSGAWVPVMPVTET